MPEGALFRDAGLSGASLLWYDNDFRASGNNSVVECDLAKVEVAGSNPVSRSNFYDKTRLVRLASLL